MRMKEKKEMCRYYYSDINGEAFFQGYSPANVNFYIIISHSIKKQKSFVITIWNKRKYDFKQIKIFTGLPFEFTINLKANYVSLID